MLSAGKRRILGALAILATVSSAALLGAVSIGERGKNAALVPPAATAYDPLAAAKASVGKLANREAPIPLQCYTKTEGRSNPCWTCHTTPRFPNLMDDWELQKEYAFSKQGMTNHWANIFVDWSRKGADLDDARVLAYVREDNHAELKAALATRSDYPGYRPDLDFRAGFDESGFARDGSAWRAFRFKPFPGAFWPTNGSTDDVMIRLPPAFRSLGGQPSSAAYRANLAILEASFASDPKLSSKAVRWPTEPLDEVALATDLDGDGTLFARVESIVGLPARYVGDAHGVTVRRALYPAGTEFLHSVRYLDPDAPNLLATRMKELRYSKKLREIDDWAILRQYEKEFDEKDEGKLPVFTGDPLVGLRNDFGWMLQGFIEDEAGRLRLQTHEEHLACMGCHSNLGVTLDQTFTFPRKLPGAAGWRYQDLHGIPDVPQLGHEKPEFLTYLERARAGDEFRANDEVIARFVADGRVNEPEVRRGAPGGDRDLAHLILPSRARALALNRGYMALVREQRFEFGRDVFPTAAGNVHRSITQESTGLADENRVYTDGQLRLDWSAL
jgi:hypothetical protein